MGFRWSSVQIRPARPKNQYPAGDDTCRGDVWCLSGAFKSPGGTMDACICSVLATSEPTVRPPTGGAWSELVLRATAIHAGKAEPTVRRRERQTGHAKARSSPKVDGGSRGEGTAHVLAIWES